MKTTKTMRKNTLLKGEGIHQHTLYGSFVMEKEPKEFAEILVKKASLLKHEKPNGSFSEEHNTLQVEQGNWVMGKQVEYNPFDKQINKVWD